jgi:outer membrane protein OmpA-like peptidoglycan-associated protein
MRRYFWLGVVSYALAFCVGFVALSCTKKVAKVQPAPIEREVAPAPVVILDAPAVDTQHYAPEPAPAVQMTLPTVYFEFDKSELTDATKIALTEIGKQIINTKKNFGLLAGARRKVARSTM